MANRVGEQLGNYRLIRLLGEGSFAEVYLGEHVILKTFAAIKVMKPNLELPEEDVEHFYETARILTRLKHPRIVQILDAGLENGTSYLVMNYLPNGSLRQLHPRSSRLSHHIIVPYVKQIAEALQYIHHEGLIHQNIKPETILLEWNNELVIGGFGTLVEVRNTYPYAIGTPRYMAPEQIRCEPCFASDQYALGVVAYEWFTGHLPFEGASLLEIINKHMTMPPPSLREKLPTIAPSIDYVILKALSKDPKNRFPNIQKFALALERACYRHKITVPLRPPEEVKPDQPVRPSDMSDATRVWENIVDAFEQAQQRNIPTVPAIYFEELKSASSSPYPDEANQTLPNVWEEGAIDVSDQAQRELPTLQGISFEEGDNRISAGWEFHQTRPNIWSMSADAIERAYHLEIGKQLGQYRLLKLLSRGMTRVYLGEHIESGMQVALRVLNTHKMSNVVEELQHEARLHSSLNHPYIVPFVEYGIESDKAFLATIYTPHGNFRQFVPDNTPQELSTVLPYLKQAASALQYIHDRGLIHCDIKPENMLIGESEDAINRSLQLCDFGLAREAESIGEGRSKAVSGTPPYMSPERIRGKPCFASDQYALGTVAYEWLCGMLPFNDPDYKKVIEQQLFVAPPSIREKVPTISPAIEAVVLKALEKDPEQRFESVTAFITALEKAMEEPSC